MPAIQVANNTFDIVMTQYLFIFGDIYGKKIRGQLWVHHQHHHVLLFSLPLKKEKSVPRWPKNLLLWKQYIDRSLVFGSLTMSQFQIQEIDSIGRLCC